MKNVALITGASSGIGAEFARIHAEKGGDLVIVARGRDKLVQIKAELEEKHRVEVLVIAKDLSDPSAAQEIFDEVKAQGIEVENLINNAGFGGLGKFHERDWIRDLSMIQLNVIALTELTRLFLPGFVARNGGKILNVSSTASLLPGPLQAVYYATKAYVTSFSNAIAEELADTNVTVTVLLPGITDTGFAQASDLSDSKLFENAVPPRSVAEDGYNAMLVGKLDVFSGLTFFQRLFVWVLPFVPKHLLLRQVKQMQEA